MTVKKKAEKRHAAAGIGDLRSCWSERSGSREVRNGGPDRIPKMGLPHPSRAFCGRVGLPRGLQSAQMHVKPVRYQNQRSLHFITFSCYHRMKLLDTTAAKETFERELERVRAWYGCYVTGYVVMPEHIHLLISEPERSKLSVVIQMLKQIT